MLVSKLKDDILYTTVKSTKIKEDKHKRLQPFLSSLEMTSASLSFKVEILNKFYTENKWVSNVFFFQLFYLFSPAVFLKKYGEMMHHFHFISLLQVPFAVMILSP